MALKASEISQLIKERIENFEASAEARDVGTVIAVTDGIVRIHGLADARYGEMLEFPGNTFGMALNLEQDSVGAVVLGDYKHISEGDTVKTTGRILEVPIGDACWVALSTHWVTRSTVKARLKRTCLRRSKKSRRA